MLTSKEYSKIIKKIYNVQGQITGIDKNAKNPFFKSDYVDLNAILSHLYPILQTEKLIINQSSLQRDNYLDTTTRITDIESGEWMENYVSVPVGTMKPQEGGSSLTYSRRYGLMTFFSLKTEDDDGNAGSGNVSGAKTTSTPKSDMVKDKFNGEVVQEKELSVKETMDKKLIELPEQVKSWMKGVMNFSREEMVTHCEEHGWDHKLLINAIDGGF